MVYCYSLGIFNNVPVNSVLMRCNSIMVSYNGRRRSRLEIVTCILNTCAKGASITKIMRESNLNYTQAYRYINSMLNKGMLKQTSSNNKKMFHTTRYGYEVLETFKDLDYLLKEKALKEDNVKLDNNISIPPGISNNQVCKYDIYAKILKSSVKGVTRTRLLNILGTNTPRLSRYLEELVKKKLIVVETIHYDRRIKGIFKVSRRGLMYLKTYAKLATLLTKGTEDKLKTLNLKEEKITGISGIEHKIVTVTINGTKYAVKKIKSIDGDRDIRLDVFKFLVIVNDVGLKPLIMLDKSVNLNRNLKEVIKGFNGRIIYHSSTY
ncbi:MAG: hypothetical protein DRO23_02100 [Thermoprotei archaeon]|mgnify:CR=1 FL=1|nr:MAG: hypothetical protein DRO23_02100 [Thermoprotei archaeon]